ncbi:PH domain-containing protein [Mesonia aquimarina]|uniref:PH domain-containing protein n=1 Tax=Mesonia aquimarina TaxID=1504967 RepID=UPI000EF629D3|nr:PH domain-containing protein [Mesonia aquimarina]
MDSIENQKLFTNRQINIDQLPDYREVDLSSISIQYRKKGFLRLIFFVVLLCIAFGIGFYFSIPDSVLYTISGVFLFFLAFGFFNVYKLYPEYGYALREKDVIYQRGFFIKKTTIIPFNRIQHVSTSRGILDKILGIANLKIFTAGGQGSDITIPGLLPDEAERLKEAVANKVSLKNEL